MIKLSQNIDFSKNFFFFGTIYEGIKEVVFEYFHGIKLIINFTFDFDNDALATLFVDQFDASFIIV